MTFPAFRFGILVLFAFLAVYKNLGIIQQHPTMGIQYVLERRSELIREIEGKSDFSKQEIINLGQGDGMRFLSFALQNLPESSTVIFPEEQFDRKLRDTILGAVNLFHMTVTLYPRTIEKGKYDFRTLPQEVLKGQRVPSAMRSYYHSSRQFVFSVFKLSAAKRYRFYISESAVSDSPNYHTRIQYLLIADSA
jgi:hypothetical protein